jgi:hypothetical protein
MAGLLGQPGRQLDFDAETAAKLNKYEFDPAKAQEILLGLGWSRDSDNVWLDADGNRMEFELTAPAEFADWSIAAENLPQQLTDLRHQDGLPRRRRLHPARHRRAGWQLPDGDPLPGVRATPIRTSRSTSRPAHPVQPGDLGCRRHCQGCDFPPVGTADGNAPGGSGPGARRSSNRVRAAVAAQEGSGRRPTGVGLQRTAAADPAVGTLRQQPGPGDPHHRLAGRRRPGSTRTAPTTTRS